MDATDVAAVLARARQGDGEAFRTLVERHSRRAFQLAFRMTGNEQDAEDVVQESFIRAYRQLDDLKRAPISAPGYTESSPTARSISFGQAGAERPHEHGRARAGGSTGGRRAGSGTAGGERPDRAQRRIGDVGAESARARGVHASPLRRAFDLGDREDAGPRHERHETQRVPRSEETEGGPRAAAR